LLKPRIVHVAKPAHVSLARPKFLVPAIDSTFFLDHADGLLVLEKVGNNVRDHDVAILEPVERKTSLG
jgi:hypothetical protein